MPHLSIRSTIPLLALLVLLLTIAPSVGADDAEALRKARRMLNRGSTELLIHTGRTVEQLGLEAADLVPMVAEVLGDPRARDKTRKNAVDVAIKLGELGVGEPLVPLLAKTIHDDNGSIVGSALIALQRIGEPAAPAMPELMVLMRREPRKTLSPIQSIGNAAVPFLIEGLSSDLPEVRAVCARALNSHNRRPEVHDPLIAAFDDPVATVRRSAIESARHLRPTSPELLDALVARLEDPDLEVVIAAVRALERSDAGALAEKVQPLLQHGNAEIRSAAARTLRRMSAGGTPLSVPIETDLANKLTDPDPAARFQAAVSLADSAPDTPGLAEVLRQGLGRNASSSLEAITALGKLGPRARSTAPDLIEFIRRNPGVELLQSRAAKSLGAMGPMPEYADTMANLQATAGSHLQVWLLYAISALDPSRNDGVAGLVEGLSSKDPVVLKNSAHALGMLGPPARAALPKLRTLLGSEDPGLKGLAEWAIGQIERQVA